VNILGALADRPLPHDLDAERAVFGSVLIRPSVWPMVASHLPMDAFFLPAHREIYDAMVVVAGRGMPLDPITVWAEIKARGSAPRIEGGEDYVHDLLDATPTSENIEGYVDIVRKTANKRSLIRLCAETASRAMGDVDDAQLCEEHARELSRVVLRNAGDLTRIGACLQDLFSDIEQRQKQQGIIGVKTGVYALDQLTCGFLPGELVIIGADPGSGKSALAVQAGLSLCIDEGGTCLDCSLEMSQRMIAERALAHMAEVNSYNLRRGKVSIDDWRDLFRAGKILEALDFYVESKITTVREFGARARVWRSRHPKRKGLGVFDFLQLAASSGKGNTRAERVGQDARDLKALAGELEVPIIAVSSLSRTPKDAAKEPPRMTDLKESGDIDYAADFVILIWNRDQTKDGPVTFVPAKNRNSPAGEHVEGRWIGRYYRFCDIGCEPPQQQSLIA
jgi:replicative DNA helicase